MRCSDCLDVQIGLYHRVCTFIVCMQQNQIVCLSMGPVLFAMISLQCAISCKLKPKVVAA